jgi:hypothetical protein
MKYTYNPISCTIGIGPEEDPEYMTINEYVEMNCKVFGFGVGCSGIITSTGPFKATMHELNDLFYTKLAGSLDQYFATFQTGDEEAAVNAFLNHAKHEQDRLREVEINCKMAMFKMFAKMVREKF